MRFLRLDFRDEVKGFDLHPLLTVISAAEQREIEQLLDAVRSFSSGSTGGLRGLIEHDGLLLEIDPAVGEPLRGLATSAAVVLHVDGPTGPDGHGGLAAELERWERQAAIDAVVAEEIRSDLDLSVSARVRRLRDRLRPPQVDDSNATAGRLRLRAVRRAFDSVNLHPPLVPRSDDELESLIERWDRYRVRYHEQEGHLRNLSARVAEAERAVTAATDAMAEARLEARPSLLSPEHEARLEALVELTVTSSRWRRGLTGEEEAEMRELLDSVGAKSWTEYSMQRMSPTVPPDKLAAVERAEDDLDQARQQLDHVRNERASDPVAADLSRELDEIKQDCQPLLGVLVPADIGGALRQRVEMIDNVAWLDALNDLRDVLSSNELHPPCGFEPAEVLGWTDSWLRAQESLLGGPTRPVGEDDEAGTEIRLELDSASHCLVRHDRALSQIEEAERVAERSMQRVAQLREQLEAHEGTRPPTTASEIVDLVFPVAERVLNEVGGSLPLAIVGEHSGLPPAEIEELMESLEEMAERLQIILVSDNPTVAQWAKRVGLERADLRLGCLAGP